MAKKYGGWPDWLEWTNCIIGKMDRLPLWWAGILLLGILLSPHLSLGQGSVFTIHDQLDESLLNYVLTARHPGEGEIPEMLGGINASGLSTAAVLYVPLFRFLSLFSAFMLIYALMIAGGFAGMYLAVKELSGSSILAVVTAGIFCMLPLYPIYGLSEMGIPLVLYAYLCLHREKHIPAALALVVLFALTSHLVCTGYVVLGFWLAAILFLWFRKGFPRWSGVGFGVLLLCYIGVNRKLIAEILLGRSLDGSISYVSHREEMINSALPFFKTVRSVFLESSQHAATYQEKLILPILILLVVEGCCYRKLGEKSRKRFLTAVCGLAILLSIAVFFGVCKLEPVVAWKNRVTGFLHYFQMERFYWLYPAGWYLEFAMAFSVWWTAGRDEESPVRAEGLAGRDDESSVCEERTAGRVGKKILRSRLVQCMVLGLMLWPAADKVLYNSYFYMNVNQKNNGSGITGYISWESYYAEELMAQLDEAIGRDKSSYRVAHLGMSPAPALMYGFYTVDGYSNNYPLDYKHAFRRVIARELDKSPETAAYFDTWGSRCYLFNSLSGNYWMLEKGSGVEYRGLDFDMQALAELGCEYLFSGGEIIDAGRMGLEPMGYFETEDSYWGIWLYKLI